jgi:hypothetical protein
MANDSPTSLSDRLLAAMGAAVELRVITVVDDVTISGTLAQAEVKFGDAVKQGNVIATSINLVQGDVTSVVPDRFWAADKQVIRDFHQAQVGQAKQIVERNLQLIGEIGEKVVKAISELRQIEAKPGSGGQS